MKDGEGIEESLMRSLKWSGLKTGWFVEILRRGLKLRYITQFKQIFRPEDGFPAIYDNFRIACSGISKFQQDFSH
jgi:hypothetical protein